MANVSRYQGEILALLRSGNHYSAEQIFKHLKKQYPFITKGGVYKVLQKLAEKDLIHKHYHLADTIVREIAKKPHAHIYCENTTEILDVQSIPVDISSLTLPEGFTPTSVNVTITGTFQNDNCVIAYKE